MLCSKIWTTNEKIEKKIFKCSSKYTSSKLLTFVWYVFVCKSVWLWNEVLFIQRVWCRSFIVGATISSEQMRIDLRRYRKRNSWKEWAQVLFIILYLAYTFSWCYKIQHLRSWCYQSDRDDCYVARNCSVSTVANTVKDIWQEDLRGRYKLQCPRLIAVHSAHFHSSESIEFESLILKDNYSDRFHSVNGRYHGASSVFLCW